MKQERNHGVDYKGTVNISELSGIPNIHDGVYDDGYRPGQSNQAPAQPKPVQTSYRVKVTASVLNVRAGAGTGFKINTQIKDKGVYTIVEEKNGWGKLKSGAGWISLAYTKRV